MSGPAMLFRCPHCQTKARPRLRTYEGATLHSFTYQCENVACGHVFRVQAEAVRTIQPAAQPNPAVLLPMSHAANQRHGAAANGGD